MPQSGLVTRDGAFPEPPPPTRDPGEPLKRATWLWIIVGAVLVVVVAASVAAGVLSPGNGSGGSAKGAASSGSASPSRTGVPEEPGEYGKPSLPGTDPFDPWKGAKPVEGVDVAGFQKTLASTWKLDFRSRPTLGGTMRTGLAGDLDRKQQRLDGILTVASDESTVYQVMCQAGGTETTVDETGLKFVADCLAQAVHGPDWDTLNGWLTQNLKQFATTAGKTTVKLSKEQMYAETDGHVVSCVIAAF